MSFICMRINLNLNLVLIQRPGETRRWAIVNHSAAVNVNHSSGLIYHLNKPLLI